MVQITNSKNFNAPAMEVLFNEKSVGHIHPFDDVLIFSAGDKLAAIKELFEGNDKDLIACIGGINDYRRNNHYSTLYIDKSVMGVAQLRDNHFWLSIGFKEDQNPQLFYLED